jgi:hypothetical protein
MVVTSRPFAIAASVRHELTGIPSSSTVQAPQTPTLQPSLVPVSARSLRRKWTSSLLSGTSRSTGCSLIRKRSSTLIAGSSRASLHESFQR